MAGSKKGTNIQIFEIFAYLFLTVHAVAQFVEASRYKSEGRAFDSRWCHWNFSFT
jgi:hypothetical protein